MLNLIKNSHHDRGFSLIELLVTLAIASLLAAIALPTYLVLRDRAKYAEIKLTLNAVYKEATAYKLEHNGVYPPDALPGQVPLAPNGLPAFANFRKAEDNPFGEVMDWDLLPDAANPGQYVAKISDTGADGQRQDDYTKAGGSVGVPYRAGDDTAIVVDEVKPTP